MNSTMVAASSPRVASLTPAPAAIILPTPTSVVSKLIIVLIVFGLYVLGLLFYTLTTDNYRLNGRMLWQFLTEQKTEHQVPAASVKVDRIRSIIHRKASEVAAETETDVSQLPPVPVPRATPTVAATRETEFGGGGEDTFVGSRSGSATGTEFSPPTWWQRFLQTSVRRIRQVWSRVMARVHVRGKTFYARKVLV